MRNHSPQRLREVLWYNPFSGEIKWKAGVGSRVAGTMTTSGYSRIVFDGVSYAAHHVAWALFKGRWPSEQIDHIDGVRGNNAIANLRECNGAENQQNRGVGRSNKSGFVGVAWHPKQGGWAAKITVNGKVRRLGVYSTPEAAAKRYAEEKRRVHKFHPDAVTRKAS